MASHLRAYYRLTKPGIVYGNALHYAAGALFAVGGAWSLAGAIWGLVGTSCLIASACVVNNLFDRSIDEKMSRTKLRPSVTGEIATAHAVMSAALIGVVGELILVWLVNPLTAAIGLIAYISYAFLYTWSKRVTPHHTIIGTLPGALPAVAGVTATTGAFSLMAVWIGVLVVVWQLPHFYAIAMYRHHEYAKAGVPLINDTLTPQTMRLVVRCLIIAFGIVAAFGVMAGVHIAAVFVLVMAAAWWVWRSFLSIKDSDRWAKKVFLSSLIVSLGLFVSGAIHALAVAI